MPAQRSEWAKTLEAAVFALSLIGLYFVQSGSLRLEPSATPPVKRAALEVLVP